MRCFKGAGGVFPGKPLIFRDVSVKFSYSGLFRGLPTMAGSQFNLL
jgi:hypothetical protein